jgi:hypothetical protein
LKIAAEIKRGRGAAMGMGERKSMSPHGTEALEGLLLEGRQK